MEPVHADYTARADEYITLLGSIEATASEDRTLVSVWAQEVDGLVLDVGCGPGHWTSYLHAAGVEVVGIDPVGAFIDSARVTYPDTDFLLGRAEDLDVPAGSIGGVLAWYSLIHTEPELLAVALDEFARVIRPGGSLLLAEHVRRAGFGVITTQERTDPGARPHGAILAQRCPTSQRAMPV